MAKKPPRQRDAGPGTDAKGVTPGAEGEAGPSAIETADTVELTPNAKRGRAYTDWDDEAEAKFRADRLRRTLHLAKVHWQKPHLDFTAERRVEYLAALQVKGNHQAAADLVGIHVRTARKHREVDKDFNADCEIALERFRHSLIDEAVRRAVEGDDEPVYQGGELVGTKRVKSDRMLEVVLRAKGGPEFRDKVDLAHSGDIGITTGVLMIPVIAADVTPKRLPSSPTGDVEPDGGVA